MMMITVTSITTLMFLFTSFHGVSALLVCPTPACRLQKGPLPWRTSNSHSSSVSFLHRGRRVGITIPTIDIMRHDATPTDDEGTKGDDIKDNSNSSDNPFSQINSFLDTPILDPNNKSNQGPIAEALKDFVRDEPQLAQITFSGFVVALFFVGLRLFNAVRYGGF